MSDKESLTQIDKFEPTRQQLQYFQVFITAKVTASDEEIAKSAGVKRQTIWNWKQKPDFNEWFYTKWQEFAYKELPKVHSVLKNKALRGDMQAIKLYLQRFDPDFTERKEKTHIIEFDEKASEAAKKMAKEALEKV